jgi:hypothetical protein
MKKENSKVGKVKRRQGNMQSLKKMKEIAYAVLRIQRNYGKWHPTRHGQQSLHVLRMKILCVATRPKSQIPQNSPATARVKGKVASVLN